ncbi:uncharacterized protein [Periplaneta americana]|uniref:uncharacterized protein isoform X1 n=1 Tax=Periplaneta americana TaxID=6978 RepID=UPI0037E78391
MKKTKENYMRRDKFQNAITFLLPLPHDELTSVLNYNSVLGLTAITPRALKLLERKMAEFYTVNVLQCTVRNRIVMRRPGYSCFLCQVMQHSLKGTTCGQLWQKILILTEGPIYVQAIFAVISITVTSDITY